MLPADAGEPGDDVFDVLPLRDEVIEFEINPDRAYALSLRGVGREAALAYGVAFSDPADRPVPASDEAAYPVVVEDPVGCPVFTGRSVTGFDPSAPTPDWMARRIQLAGMRPISLAVDVTNYVMLELGQPIHGFDRDKLAGPIVVRRARPGERVTTLDGADRELSAEDLLITDDSGPIGLAGVMGGETTELSETTTNVFIEAAHWDPVTIFRTERRHKLPSEAAKRFERGTDPTIALVAADRVAELLTTYGGGTVEHGVTYVGGAAGPRTDRHRRRSAGARHRHGHLRRDHGGQPACRGLRGRGVRVLAHCHPAALARRPHRPLRPGRGGRADRRLRQRAVGAAAGRPRPWPDAQPAPAPPDRPHAGRRGLRRGRQLPVRRHARPRRARPAPPTIPAATCSVWPTRCRRRSRR